MSKPFGTLVVDPPWPYRDVKASKSSGYSGEKYRPMSLEDLASLPLAEMGDYLFLWTVPPFHADGSAAELVRAWGFQPVTCLYWVKTEEVARSQFSYLLSYGVGYWFRGCVEPVLVCKVPKVKSVRSPWLGLICNSGRHSRKPNHIYEVVEADFPGPYCELFGRRAHQGEGEKKGQWTVIGNEAPDTRGEDIRESVKKILRRHDRERG